MKKDVSFNAVPPSKAAATRADQAFAGLELSQPPEPVKRLTINVPQSLHSRVKLSCVRDETTIADVVRNFLEKRFPEEPEHG